MMIKKMFPFFSIIILSAISTAISSSVEKVTDLERMIDKIEKKNQIEVVSINLQKKGDIYEVLDLSTQDGRILSNEELKNIETQINGVSLKPDPGV